MPTIGATPASDKIQRARYALAERYARVQDKQIADFLKRGGALLDARREWINQLLDPINEGNVNFALAAWRWTPEQESAWRDLLAVFFAQAMIQGAYHMALEARRLRDGFGRYKTYADPLNDPLSSADGLLRDTTVLLSGAASQAGAYAAELAAKESGDLMNDARQIVRSGFENGLLLKEIKANLGSKFQGWKDGRLGTVAETEITKFANRGRLALIEQSDSVKQVQFVAIVDRRTTKICKARHGLVMKTDDPALKKNTPPLHFRCRSVWSPVFDFENLEDSAAFKDPDLPQPYKGFGGTEPEAKKPRNPRTPRAAKLPKPQPAPVVPPVVAPPAKPQRGPDARRLVAEHQRGYTSRVAALEGQADALGKRLDAASVELDQYLLSARLAKYPDLLAQRNALMEAIQKAADARNAGGLESLTPELRALNDKLDDLTALSAAQRARQRELLQESGAIEKELETTWADLGKLHDVRLKEQRAILAVDDPIDVAPDWRAGPEIPKAQRVRIGNGFDQFRSLISKTGTGLADPLSVPVFSTKQDPFRRPGARIAKRAFQFRGAIYCSPTTFEQTTVHELGHWLEEAAKSVFSGTSTFYAKRTAGEAPISLRRATGNRGYAANEYTRKDQFKNPYAGKVYESRGTRTASEIVSMGLEQMYENPNAFAISDPDYFDFIFDLMRGAYQ